MRTLDFENIKLILFDFDGTISDSHDVAIDVYNGLAEDYGFRKILGDDLRELRQKTSRDAMKFLGVSYYKLPFVLREARKRFQKKVDTLLPIEGIQDALGELRGKDYKLGILTSNSKENVCKFLEKNGLNVFDHIRSGVGLFGKTKVLKDVLKQCKVQPFEAIYVGDETRDIDAARAAGVRIISVAWGFNSREVLFSQKPDLLLDEPIQLNEIFTKPVFE